jgi:hypothetical protein
MANPFVHIELHTDDVAKAKAFYSRLFGWKLEDMQMPGGGGSYTTINVGGGTGGGMMKNMDSGAPSHWLAYVGVEDVASSTRNAKELGAKVLQEKMEVGSYGFMSLISDPTGAVFALWQPKAPEKK